MTVSSCICSILLFAYSARLSASLQAASRPNCLMSFRCRSASYPETKIGEDLPESHGEGNLSFVCGKKAKQKM